MSENSQNQTVADQQEPGLAPRLHRAAQTELVGDSDAQSMVVASLRTQIQDLISQVTQLNAKLVKSYDRVSDLEDDLHLASSNLRTSSLKISHLEFERTQHLAALNTGLLVERSHVTTELNRLMEKATEEAAQRGRAEEARSVIEKELADLSANLFEQANTMVAEARYQRALSERKVEKAEAASKIAEEAVRDMQQRMQVLDSERETAERSAEDMRALMEKGKWINRILPSDVEAPKPLKLLASISPYQEFLFFVAHLRNIRPATLQLPAISTLLSLPFLARLQAEDSEPTLRLDLAPSLNWLSRRSVLAAIHAGQLTIEPMSLSTFQEHHAPGIIPGTNIGNTNTFCALCGTSIFPASSRNPSPTNGNSVNGPNSWSATLFRNPLSYSYSTSVSPSPSTTPPRANSRSPTPQQPSQQIHIFRVSPSSTSTSTLGISITSSLPLTSASPSSSSQQSPTHNQHHNRGSVSSTIYPLCTSGWCLSRMRTTCSLWAFVRTSVIEKVWDEEIPALPPPPQRALDTEVKHPPPLPPRKRGLWGMASALSERAASWSEASKLYKEDKTPSLSRSVSYERRPATTDSTSSVSTPLSSPTKAQGKRKEPDNASISDSLYSNGTINADVAQKAIGDAPSVSPTSPATQMGTRKPTSPVRYKMKSPPKRKPVSIPPEELTSMMVSEQECVPSMIPLPESEPPTPLNAATFQSPPHSPAPEATEHRTPTSPSKEPPRAATPTRGPPPLPPRAAARAPRVPPPTPPPAPNALVVSAGTIPNTDSDHKSETKETPEVGEAMADAAGASDKVAEPTKQVNQVEETAPVLDNPSSPLPTDNSNTSQSTTSEAEPGLVNDVKIEAKTNGIDVPVENGTEEGTVNKAKDAEVYLGDATWEERTWKELIRLKEDVFQARIGGSR